MEFDRAADPDLDTLDLQPNILGIRSQSTDPLTLVIEVPPAADIRDFSIGNRVIVDIYDPASGPVQPPEQGAVTPSQEEADEGESLEIAEPVSEPAEPEPEQEPEETSQPGPQQNTQADTLEESQIAPEQASSPEELLLTGPNLITISATQGMGMVVFENNGRLYMLNDVPELLLRPQVGGDDAEALTPLSSERLDEGLLFSTPMPANGFVRTQGGGLLWRIVLSPEFTASERVMPRREKGAQDGITLIWPFETPRKVIDFEDPLTGAELKVVSVENHEDYFDLPLDLPELRVIPAKAGLVVRPRTDDISVEITSRGVEVTRPGGLAATPQREFDQAFRRRDASRQINEIEIDPSRRIFNFESWQMGGMDALNENRTIILSGLPAEGDALKAEGTLTLAKMFLANAQGAEALGMLGVAEDVLPDLTTSPEFLAIRGAAQAIDGKYESAFSNLSQKDLPQIEEIQFWRSYVLAALGDWQQAEAVLPDNADVLFSYPDYVINRLAPGLIEVALRAGDTDLADSLFALVEENEDTLFPQQQAALDYLRGEKWRQRGDLDQTIELWQPLSQGEDELYRAKAGLALTRLLMENERIDNEQAIDNLERLRYAWRGDQLEAQINYWLGRTYFESGEYAKGLNIMREAASLAGGLDLGRRITSEMSEVFTDLFLSDSLNEVSPLDAAVLYDQFPELVPTDERGDRLVERLAERLVQADLLGRAAGLLDYQITHRLQDFEAYRVAVRLAAIYLLDNQPAQALETLSRAEQLLAALPAEEQTRARRDEIQLLRARAVSRRGRPDQAIEILRDMEPGPDVHRLLADIAWRAGYWDDAAEAINDVLLDRDISLTRPLSTENSMLILQRATALNLANDRISLANIREKYSEAMAQTPKGKIFDVVTRPRQSSGLADRDTLLTVVSEVDLFADFLNSYKAVQTPSQ